MSRGISITFQEAFKNVEAIKAFDEKLEAKIRTLGDTDNELLVSVAEFASIFEARFQFIRDKPKVIKAININVTEQIKNNPAALDELSFSKLANIYFILNNNFLQGKLLEKIEKLNDDPESNKPIGAIVKVLDKIQKTDLTSIAFEPQLVKICRSVLREENNFYEHSVPVKARLLKIMTRLKFFN